FEGEYVSSGLRRNFHGVIYQIKLLALFSQRAINYEFSLATEMDEAEKFDDIVLQYREQGKQEISYLFLQAKHKQDEDNKKITIKELLKEAKAKSNNFSFEKYFTSYCEIVRNSKFASKGIKDFIIFTNIN